MKLVVTIIALNMLLAGCVSVSRFDEQQATLEACRDQAQKDTESWQEMRSGLEADLNKTKEELNNCMSEYQQAQTSVQEVEQRAQTLRQSLQEEILARNVEIETLKGKLSVRVLDRILFKSGSAQILPEGEAVLNKLAAALLNTDDYIRVEGHTDNVPIGQQLKARYFSNWELSAARASSVVRFFQHAHKIDPLRLEPVGFSEYRPVAEGETAEELQRNRRVEIILTQPRK